MNWKKWPYWAKGGMAGIVYSCIVFTVAGVAKGELAAAVFFLFNLPSLFILGVFTNPLSKYENLLLLYGALLLTNSAIATFLGYLYGKFKNRKSFSSSAL